MADVPKLRGFKWDPTNLWLEVWVNGTEIARFSDSGSDLQIVTLGMTVDSGGYTNTAGDIVSTDSTDASGTSSGAIHTGGGFGVAENIHIGGDVSVIDEITYSAQLVHKYAVVSTVTLDTTLDAADCGKTIESATDSAVITLPATAPGLTFTIVNTGENGSTALNIVPETGDFIKGCDMEGADGGYIVNTRSSHKKGDMVRLTGDSADGWYITRMTGTWVDSTG